MIFTNPLNNTLFYSLCSKQHLLEIYGNSEIILSTANTHSYDKSKTKLHVYIKTMMDPQDISIPADQTLYHFGDNNYEEFHSLFATYQRPPYPKASSGTISWGKANQ